MFFLSGHSGKSLICKLTGAFIVSLYITMPQFDSNLIGILERAQPIYQVWSFPVSFLVIFVSTHVQDLSTNRKTRAQNWPERVILTPFYQNVWVDCFFCTQSQYLFTIYMLQKDKLLHMCLSYHCYIVLQYLLLEIIKSTANQ